MMKKLFCSNWKTLMLFYLLSMTLLPLSAVQAKNVFVNCGGGWGTLNPGQGLSCRMGEFRLINQLKVAVGCNDGEIGHYTFSFDDGSKESFIAGCGTVVKIAPRFTKNMYVRMNWGGGGDNHISFYYWGAWYTQGAKIVVNADSNNLTAEVGNIAHLNGSFIGIAKNAPYTYLWKFGDGNTATGTVASTGNIPVTHSFNQQGEFTASLEITDRKGNTSKDEVTVKVIGSVTDDPCDVPTVRSQSPWGLWDYPSTWDTGVVPTKNDWVLIQGGHHVILPLTGPISVKGLCIAENGFLQSAFNRLNSPSSAVNVYAASIHNKGTIIGANGINASPLNGSYRRATASSRIKLWAYKVVNDTTGLIKSNSGGDDRPYLYLPHRSRWNTIGGAGGQIEIYPAIIENNGRIEAGKGGNAYNNAYSYAHGHNGYYTDGHHARTVLGSAYGGNGGLVRVFATNLALSTNAGPLIGGCGGNAFGVNWRWGLGAGVGGDIYANVGNNAGRIKGCTGSVAWWDPTTLTATNTTVIKGTDHVIIFGGSDWVMNLSELSEGSVSAAKTITLSLGKGGVIELPTTAGNVFQAAEKVEIFAEHFRLNGAALNAEQAEAHLNALAEAPNILIHPSRIFYHVEMSHADYLVGEPGETIPVKLTLLNGGPTADTYDINMTNSEGWSIKTNPLPVTVNSMRFTELTVPVPLPKKHDVETLVTLTATSQSEPNVQAIAKIRVGVMAKEVIRPRGPKKPDISLVIDNNTNTRVDLVMMLSNTLEGFLGHLTEPMPPKEAGVTAEELESLTDEQFDRFIAGIQLEKVNTPTVELMSFRDNVITHIVTDNLGEVIGRIRSLPASTSTDCSEAPVVAALESALENIKPNGQIILVTASFPYQPVKDVIANAQQQGVKIHVLSAGTCENAEKARYQSIADNTGGTFQWLSRKDSVEQIKNTLSTVVDDSFIEMMALIDDDEPIAPAECGLLYGVHDQGLNNSIFFTVNSKTGEIKQLGEICQGCDIEAMDIHPETQIIYVASGNDTYGYPRGHLFQLDARTGELMSVGSSLFGEIGDLSFNADSRLWAWAKKVGLVQLDIDTGNGTLIQASDAEIEGLAFNLEGTALYGSVGTELWGYDPATGDFALLCDNLPQETEAVEVLPETLLPEGFVLLGMHKDHNNLLIFDVNNCQTGQSISITPPYDDPEGLAMPLAACTTPQ
jgi:hypothetical protein